MLYYSSFLTVAGWIGVLSSSSGLVKTTFPQISREQSLSLLNLKLAKAAYSNDLFQGALNFYTNYYKGKNILYSGELDLSHATDFQRTVWKAACRIPYGETRSYSWIAKEIGKPLSLRASGSALGKNPLPIIIPCHRIINKNDQLGGFGGGLDMKRFLLNLERREASGAEVRFNP
jgi:methylated-DNA-[protein]-cysteine S-methyltransferase